MGFQKIRKDVYYVGVQDWDRRTFDELIPLPDGTSYNAYVIRGSEKIALIDAVDPPKIEELLTNLRKLGISKLDYVISNHAEQDHSGGIPMVLEMYPEAVVVTNSKCKTFLQDLLNIPAEKFLEIKHEDTLSLGNKTLKFLLAAWVHWPETMFTYLEEDKILFPGDLFGSHMASSELFVLDEAKVYFAAKRYFAEIMMPFRTNIQKHMDMLNNYELEIIAPTHGQVYDNPEFILEQYKNWISDGVENKVLIPYVSMHGSVEKMVNYLTEKLTEYKVTVIPFNMSVTDIGEFAMELVDAATVVIGSSTVHAGPHPKMIYAAYLTNMLRPKAKFASIIGSYGWGSRMVDMIKDLLTNFKGELLEPVISKGYPKEVDFKALDELAELIAMKHKNL